MPAEPLRLLGPPALLGPAGAQLFAPRRPDQLLAFLACRHQWVTRAELAEMFWPDRSDGAARANLRVLLVRTQRQQAGLELQAERVRWVVDSDLLRLHRALAAGDHAAVVELYGAPLLEGLEPGMPEPLLEWLSHERQQLDAQWRRSLRQRLADRPAGDAQALELAARLERSAPGAHASEGMLDAAARADHPDAFIGRRAELAELRALVRRGTRWVVLSGPGGVGKTALMRAALPELAALQGAGHRAIALADLQESSQVPARIATALGLALRPGGDGWDRLAGVIGSRPLWLGLDNAEHLVNLADLTAGLARLLAACPGLCLLVSSRQRDDGVGPVGPVVLALDGLPLPDADETEMASLRQFDAVRLFEARARAVTPGMDLARQQAALLRVLRATDGLPLALELAAAATRLMPLAQVADELSRSLDVLDAAAGARGIRACFDRSWTLLHAALQDGLARLAWLPGGFSRDMALRVAQVTLADLAALVDRSLLQVEPDGRLRLHPLLRQFVAERQPAADAQQLATRHAAYVGHLLGTLDTPARLSDPTSLQTLDDELPHVRAAWAWAVGATSPSLLKRLARVMGRYHVLRGGGQDILPFLSQAVQAIAGPGRAALSARALTLRTQAMLEYHSGALVLAQAHARDALRWAARAGDAETALACLTVLGNALLFAGDAAAARAPFEQARQRALARGDLALAGAALNGLGLVERAAGRYAQALAHFREGGQLCARVGDHAGQVTALINVGNIEMLERRWPEALRSNEAALAAVESGRLDAKRAIVRTILADIAIEMDQWDVARAHAEAALAALDRNGEPVVPVQVRLVLCRIETAEGRLAMGAEWLSAAVAAARAVASSTQQLSCLNAAGRWLARAGEVAEAAQLLAWVHAHPEASHSVKAAALQASQAAGLQLVPPTTNPALPEVLDGLMASLAAWVSRPSIRS